ncbi:MAG: hypothetical protein H6752_18640 [Candidatus Omnitrophica bacterium]|nr:hypothetical protein [Candidatus Omnitrophota bacterium]
MIISISTFRTEWFLRLRNTLIEDANPILFERSWINLYNGSAYDVSEEWKYKWNPRDQMTQAMKWEGSASSTDNVGAVS